MVVGLDHLQVAAPAAGEELARAFYGALLGLAELAKPPALRARGGVWFALGDGRELHIGIEEGFEPARKAHPGLRIESPESLRTLAGELARAGHEPRWPPPGEVPGTLRCFVDDPFGNRLELLARET